MGKKLYSIHEDLGYVTISKFVSFEEGWERIAVMSMEELIKKVGLDNK